MTWFLLAFIAPLLWAVVTLLDTYFVHGVYRDAMDGAVISGLFQSVPWLLVLLGVIEFDFPGVAAATYSLIAGALFLLAFLAYFEALFITNDGALMQLLWNITVLVVPFFAWLLIGEKLELAHYLGIALAFVGLTCFGFDKRVLTPRSAKIGIAMLSAIGVLALSMVASKKAYLLAAPHLSVSTVDFWRIFLLFCTGASAASCALLSARGWTQGTKWIGGMAILSKRYFLLLLMAEMLSLVGSLASQRAISLAPSVSLVAVIECLVPVFVMMASLLLVALLRVLGQRDLVVIYRTQLVSPGRKFLSLILIASGIYIIS